MANSSKPRFRLFISVILFGFGLGIFFMMRGCSSDVSPITSNMLLQQDGKRYLFTMFSTEMVKEIVDNGKTPAAMNSTLIYKDGDEVYMQPQALDKLVAILRGSCTVHSMKDGSVDGYLTADSDQGVKVETEFKSTSKLGEQHQIITVILENRKGKKMSIRWTFNPKVGEYYGMKNCEVHGFWTETHPAPGETVWSTTDYLVIPVSSLADFFGRSIEFDEENTLLIIGS